MIKMSDRQIRAMVSLLEDPDEHNAELVTQSLVGLGADAIPSIVRAFGMVPTGHHDRLESILDEIRLRQLETAFGQWAASGSPDLEEGSFLVARFGDPDLDISLYKKKLDQLANDLRTLLKEIPQPPLILTMINQHLFEQEQFRGNIENYYDPDNSYLNRVLERKTGIPITLSVLYLLVARRLNLPVTGIGLPGHFILKYESPEYIAYLDPFHQGQILSRADCMRFLTHSGYTADDSYLAPVTDREIIIRMVRNLAYIYRQSGATPMVDRLRRIALAMNSSL
jgi:regulator of sirC expression with transglutaminase-like and TPR domain